jgi:hypothetical protein
MEEREEEREVDCKLTADLGTRTKKLYKRDIGPCINSEDLTTV